MAGLWAERWIGHPAPDCAALVREVLAAEFGIDVALPSAPQGIRACDGAVDRGLNAGLACPLTPDEAARDGDGVLMRAAGRINTVGHHMGLYVAGPDPACLHWRAGLGGVLHRLRDLRSRGLEVVGLYRWELRI